MKMKKMIPLALALTVVATSSAGAAYRPITVRPNGQHSQVITNLKNKTLQEFCEKYGFSFCGSQWNCPVVKPEQKPDVKPDETPDVKPEEKPDETPDVKPEEKPDQTPDVKPEEKPDQTPDVKPEEKPDETPDVKPEEKPDQTPDVKPEEKPDGGQTQGNYAAEVVRLVNAERAKQGLSALKVSTTVQSAAQVRAKEIKQSFSHTRPNGSSCFTALTEAGVSYRGAGENIAYGQSTPAAVMNAWMNSEGHRANIMNGSFTTIGVGYTVINGTPYWTQMFTS
ncbi:CAP domain-containing protein [Butyricicoccus faecihominis]|uniref:CAP domain-containing protein n=1 Tax=Butyricicoccus faecihominis TaxID=1712515 RepID=UPI00247B0F0D|nr:CAP domain-containing protein [Butyricicoccus faecihominis]MCQ5128705.1 CAP domain-containing protein [Butyricicoccus faecihominis]